MVRKMKGNIGSGAIHTKKHKKASDSVSKQAPIMFHI